MQESMVEGYNLVAFVNDRYHKNNICLKQTKRQ